MPLDILILTRDIPPLTPQEPRGGLLQFRTDVLQDVVVLLGLELLGERQGFAAHLWEGAPTPQSAGSPTLLSRIHTHHYPYTHAPPLTRHTPTHSDTTARTHACTTPPPNTHTSFASAQ